MAQGTKIEWTDATWNPVVGCSRVSEGCRHCYAERMAGRLASMGHKQYQSVIQGHRWNAKTTLVDSVLEQPLNWRKPRRVFVCSMSDLFHETVPFDWIDRVFAVMALCPQHTFQVLTKRPERAAEWYEYAVNLDNFQEELDRLTLLVEGEPFAYRQVADGDWPINNVWLGTSIENHQAADERIPHLLRCPAAVRWLSVEPMLGPVCLGDIEMWRSEDAGVLAPCSAPQMDIDWVVIGCESGPGRRPMDLAWARDVIRQCDAAGVPVFVKQLSMWQCRECNSTFDEPTVAECETCTECGGKLGGEQVFHDIDAFPADLQRREMPG